MLSELGSIMEVHEGAKKEVVQCSTILTSHLVNNSYISLLVRKHNYLSVLSIRAAGQNSQLLEIFGRLLSSHLTVNFGKKLKIRKTTKIIETSASNVPVEIKTHFRSFKRVYLSCARWKLIEGSWNACDILTDQDSARKRLKIMKRSRKNNCKSTGSNF